MATHTEASNTHIDGLKRLMKGEVTDDMTTRHLYSTDASAYQETPMAVAFPENDDDVAALVRYAFENGVPIIPRGAGTSLAGQVVGSGIVADVSRRMNSIIELNVAEKWVDVQPGVVLDELNLYLRSYGLFFGPETSTSNRCTIGGMVGNNSCGSRSLVYGSTRDHLLEVQGFLPNGDAVTFKALTHELFLQKLDDEGLEGDIYRMVHRELGDAMVRQEIEHQFPHRNIKRRNTGYAIDLLAQMEPFEKGGMPFNLCKLIAGSEGTLMFATRIRLNLLELPSPFYGLLCAHFGSLNEALTANLIALKHNPTAVELMDKTVLDLTKGNIVQRKNRFFIQDDPKALLLVEFNATSETEIELLAHNLTAELQRNNLGYAFPLLKGGDIVKVWSLRKAGLGVLSNMPGDDLPVPVIEDTAVRAEDLGDYLTDIAQMLARFGKSCVYYGHVGSGELHLRPVLNMKDPHDVALFRTIALDTATIVKKYRGSLSGEHGDGRLRGQFIPLMVGERNYQLMREFKHTFDPRHILNPGKITDTPPMDRNLRYSATVNPSLNARFRWPVTGGLVQGADKCNGSADCRKSQLIGGGMCPSFMATRNEEHTTRARANMLRLFMTQGIGNKTSDLNEVKRVLDLCLMCKACKAECPSNIDVAKLKMEFLDHYQRKVGLSLRDKMFAYQPALMGVASRFPALSNAFLRSRLFRGRIASVLRIDSRIELPRVAPKSLRKMARHLNVNAKPEKLVWLFVDEFTNVYEPEIGITTIRLLERLGYAVKLAPNVQSGRTFMSKGMLHKAKRLAERNVRLMSHLVSTESPLVGIEPSAILAFRDEYPDLVDESLAQEAADLGKLTYTIEEFLWREIEKGAIAQSEFTDRPAQVLFHAHCSQKVLSDASITHKLLSFPVNYSVRETPSGCCGMAGSFGYEAEHADVARAIGEMSLFPAVRSSDDGCAVVAAGMSCRHHIGQNTQKTAVHPVKVLFDALR